MELIAGVVAALASAMAAWVVRGLVARSEQTALEAAHREHTAGLEAQIAQGGDATSAVEDLKAGLGEAVATALRDGSRALVGMADENFQKTMAAAKGELDDKHRRFEGLVKPLSEGYERLNPQIEQLSAQVQSVTAETAKLSGALSDNRQVGQWGEIQLRRVVEMAGMAKHCDFVEQAVAEGTRGRPDMVVRLPNDRAVVVDAKASTGAFLEARTADDGVTAKNALDRHAKALKRQIDDLAKKNYGAGVVNAVDFTVMFVPGDQFLSAALEVDPELVAYGMAKRVAIATPASLIALLWAVAHGWQQVDIARNAKEIEVVGRDLYHCLVRFVGKCQGVGKALENAVKAHNDTIGTFDSSVLPKGRRFAEMVVGDADEARLRVGAVESQVRVSKCATNSDAGRCATAGATA